MQSLTSGTALCTCLKVLSCFFFSTKHRMFGVMVNVSMREGAFYPFLVFFFVRGDNNMHKEQCIGPGHGASPWWFPVCSVAASINRSTTASSLVMGKV